MRQLALFVLTGLIQAALDTLLFGVLLSFGVPTAGSNVASRICAALFGFMFNRYVTFGQRADTLRRFGGSLTRYIVLFATLTFISTTSILLLERSFGSAFDDRIVYKIGVEAVLAFVSFVISKHWVYRR